MIPLRSGAASVQGGGPGGNSASVNASHAAAILMSNNPLDTSTTSSNNHHQNAASSSQQSKKSTSKQRANNGGGGAGVAVFHPNNSGAGGANNALHSVQQNGSTMVGIGFIQPSQLAHTGPQQLRQDVNHLTSSGGALHLNHQGPQHHPNQHMQTAKIPQHFLSNNPNLKGGIQVIQGGNIGPSVHHNYHHQIGPQSALAMTNTDKNGGGGSVGSNNLSASQKKRISLKKLEEEYCKTIEQIGSPNANNTLNLENMKKTQSLHYMRAGSGASSPQQVKSRTSIGKYNHQMQQQNAAQGMAIYNNYNNQVIASGGNHLHHQNPNALVHQQQIRNTYLSKSQIGNAAAAAAGISSVPGGNTQGGGLSSGSRSRSKTTNRKKRNLYTSIGNYYQSQTNGSTSHHPNTNNSASRVTKRVHQQNFLENLEQTNLLIGGNLAVAHQFLQDEVQAKKRNKSSTKSYNNKELLDHNNSSEICYSSHLTKKNPLNNNFFDMSQFSSNHNSIAKNFENSFQFTAGGFLPNSGKQNHNNSSNNNPSGGSLSAVSANKQRPTSSHKSALFAAAAAVSNNSSSAAKPKKKAQGLRKSVNVSGQPLGGTASGGLQQYTGTYGQLQQNAYDFLSNASLFMNSNKAARRPKGGNSAIDSRCSQTKDNVAAIGGLVKSQMSSNTAFGQHGHQQHLNNTSHTTICSNRKQGISQGDIVSGKKHSLQQQQNYMSISGGGMGPPTGQHTSDMLTAGEISSDRQTLKMNDFLKQIEAYSNDKLDKFMPAIPQSQNMPNIIPQQQSSQSVVSGSVISNYNLAQQARIAEQVKSLIDREMAMVAIMRNNTSKQRYNNQGDESRGGGESGADSSHQNLPDDEEDEEDEENGEEENHPDYEHLLNVISESFNQLIATFYLNNQSAVIGASLARVKESYEEIINSIVENLSQQIESLSLEAEQTSQENAMLKDINLKLQSQVENSEKSSQQVLSYTKQNEALVEELKRLYEENKSLKKDSKDRDGQLIESKKLIEKLTASQKQLLNSTNMHHHQSQGSSKTAVAGRPPQTESMPVLNQYSSKGANRSSTNAVPPLDLGKLTKLHQVPNLVQQPPLMSNDSLQTLDKALLNANLQDPSQSSVMNTVPHHEGSRMLEELYSHQQPPFQLNQSNISYQNSDEGDPDAEAAYLNGGINMMSTTSGQLLNQSGRLSQIAQDKSPLMKPFIPPLNLAGLNNRQQAAAKGQQQSNTASQSQMPQQQVQQVPPQNNLGNSQHLKQQTATAPKFKLDLSAVNNNQSAPQQQQQHNFDQDSQAAHIMDYQYSQQKPAPSKPSLGLNLGALKQQKGIVDFQDEFMAKADEYSQSWRDAMKREKRF